ncbi:MAG: hypothetical protein JWM80_2645 [Cyanobacteria bacterium RYN_339]|nr:hypothetical protein [Cyanobacteria bacterium RYN_339]
MQHSFHFKRGDTELSFSGNRDFVEAQVAAYLPALLGQAPAATPRVSIEVQQELPRVNPEFRPKRNISLADFVALKAAVAPTDLVVVAGYYMEKYMQQESYGPADLQAQLRELPAWDCQVVDEVLPVTILQGYMEELREQRYTLTYKGQTYVRDGLT